MKKTLAILFAVSIAFSVAVFGRVTPANGSAAPVTQVNYVKRKSRKVYRRTKHGTKVVYYKSKRGTKRTYHKTKRVTKHTYSKAKDKVTN
jgi:uncharacterized protein YxeA